MSQHILEKLFDSPTKLRLLKLFLRNPEKKLTSTEIRKKTLLKTSQINRELKNLSSIDLVKTQKVRGKRDKIYFLNTKFVFIEELRNLILKSSPADEKKLTQKLKSLGGVKLAVLSGIFVRHDDEDARADILIVGNKLDNKKLKNFMRNLEAEAGKELDYAIFTADEFKYRQKMFDRFLRDILEKPHRKLVNKILK